MRGNERVKREPDKAALKFLIPMRGNEMHHDPPFLQHHGSS